ncbi:PAS domain S-box protein [Phenylobacterium sp.]|uniref:PAS domain S-box protein n=1 Tax=Phenylobacterium sp. TaxID=1871053 RepID=UPI00286EAB2D|nr:PAS domain S-box protein [Phenylobacterium sp.]
MIELSEAARLCALDDYQVLDSAPEAAFDRLTALAADLFHAPIALVSLVDAERQWFKSRHGLDAVETPRSQAFCAHALPLAPGATLVVEDATRDPRFRSNPLVTGDLGIRFYAGAVLTGRDGHNLGTLCVIDTKPRPTPGPEDLDRLRNLARVVVDTLELRRAKPEAEERRRLVEMTERISGVGNWRYQSNRGHLTWSDEVYRIHGVTPESFDPAYAGAVNFYIDGDSQRVDQAVTEALRTGEGFKLEARIRRPDGEVRDVLCKADCIRGALGEVIGLHGVFQDVTEQKQAVHHLESLVRRAEAAESVAHLGNWRLDARTRELTWSPQMYEIYGLSPDSPLNPTAVLAVYHPDDVAVAEARVARQLTTGEAVEGAITRILRDGEVRYLSYNSRGERGPDGELVALVGTAVDITRQHRAELAVAESEAKYRALAENSTDILVRFGRDGLIRYMSPACRRLGLDPDEEVGRPIARLIAPDHLNHSAAIIAALFSGAEIDTTVRRQHKIVGEAGREVWLEGSPNLVRDASGEVVEVVTVLRDVTARHEIEAALAQSEHRFRTLTTKAPDMISEMRLDGTLTYVSPASQAILGFTPEEMIGRTPFSFMHPDDAARVLEMCKTVFESEGQVEPWSVEYRAYDKAGQELWMESKPTFVTDPVSGRFVGLTDVMRDITSRKALEAKLRLAQAEAEAAAAVKTEFLANMSHELRTPLTSIIGFTSLAGEQPDLAPLTRAYVERVGDASRALLCTVNDILDFSKLEAGQVTFQVQPVALAKLSRATLDLFTPQAGAKDLRLTLDGEDGDLILSIDPDRIRQILLNLVGNAVKFTQGGGVTLRTRYDAPARTLKVEVVDTGAGIPADKQDRLFQRFSQVDGALTRAHGGTGLGLAICKGLVEAMGGQIGVESEIGRGSRFWFTVPAPLAQAPEVGEDGSPVTRPTFVGVRVLVVDDHPANRELARLFLAGVGAEVTEACDGEEAVRLAAELPFDVILMDIRMPRLDGPGALHAIRAAPGPNDATPILAFTADAASDNRLLALGFQDIVAKPLQPGALITAVARASDFTSQPWSAVHAG